MNPQQLRHTYQQCVAETDCLGRTPDPALDPQSSDAGVDTGSLQGVAGAVVRSAAAAADTQVSDARPDRVSGQVVLQPGAAGSPGIGRSVRNVRPNGRTPLALQGNGMKS